MKCDHVMNNSGSVSCFENSFENSGPYQVMCIKTNIEYEYTRHKSMTIFGNNVFYFLFLFLYSYN